MALLHGVKSISIPCLGVDHECDRQTDGQTDILVVNAALNHVALRGQISGEKLGDHPSPHPISLWPNLKVKLFICKSFRWSSMVTWWGRCRRCEILCKYLCENLV